MIEMEPDATALVISAAEAVSVKVPLNVVAARVVTPVTLRRPRTDVVVDAVPRVMAVPLATLPPRVATPVAVRAPATVRVVEERASRVEAPEGPMYVPVLSNWMPFTDT